MGKTIIVTRYRGAVEWLKSKGIDGTVISRMDPDVSIVGKGDSVYGSLPVEMVSKAVEKGAEVFILSVPEVCFKQRDKYFSPQEMDKEGCALLSVKKIKLEKVIFNAE